MKHKIALLVSLGIIAAATISAVNAHRAYVHQLTVQNAITAANQARQAAVQKMLDQAKTAEQQAQLKALQTACQHGLDAYNLLTPSQQKRVTQPACVLQ